MWEAGDKEATDRVFAEAEIVVKRDAIYPRCHPAPLETCGMIADFNPLTGQLDIYNGNQAPNVHAELEVPADSLSWRDGAFSRRALRRT